MPRDEPLDSARRPGEAATSATEVVTPLNRGRRRPGAGPAGPKSSVVRGRQGGMDLPTFTDVLAARRRIAPHLRPTPLYRYPALDAVAGTEVWVKHENHQPIGAFKVRGGVNLMARLAEDDRRRGVATASTGNHGQSIAWAGRLFGVPVLVCVPEGANPVKVEAMRLLGATVVAHGPDFEAAREYCERLADKEGRRYVHVANEPDLIA